MADITLHVSVAIPAFYLQDDTYESTYEYIKEGLQELAEGLEGSVVDVEIK